MPNKMLIDATHPEETRVVVVRGNRVEEFDFETAQRKQLRGNIYLAKVTRVEPSLQAAFIEYGGNRHGFLAFSEIHPDYYQIPVADRQALIEADERAHREAEEESENRSNRRRPRHRNSRRRGNGERIQSEVIDNASLEPQPAAGSRDVHAHDHHEHDHHEHSEGDHTHDAGFHHDDAQHGGDAERHDHDNHDHDHHDHDDHEHPHDHEHAHDEHGHADDEHGHFHAGEIPAAMTEPDAGAVETSIAVPAASASAEAHEDHARDEARHEEDARENAAHADDAARAEDLGGEIAEHAGEEHTAPHDMHARAGSDENHDDEDDADEAEEEVVEFVGGDDVLEEVPERAFRPRRQYKIQEVIKRRQVMLVQVVKEERGNKGAALTTYLSLAGRYAVLMPNTARGGGISRKITARRIARG